MERHVDQELKELNKDILKKLLYTVNLNPSLKYIVNRLHHDCQAQLELLYHP